MRALAAAVLLGVVISSCGGAGADTSAAAPAAAVASATPTPPPTPSPTPTPTPVVYWPLRGTLASDPAAVRRRPIAVRIGNDPQARPVSGLSRADMVFELITEGGVTRYTAVFHSQDADSIGPVRSARLSELHLLPMLRGILGYVGASGPVRQRLQALAKTGAFVDIDEWYHGPYFPRIATRPSPQTVYTSTKNVRAAAAADGATDSVDVPVMVASSVTAGAPSGTPARTFTIPYDGPLALVTYTYDGTAGELGGYTHTQGGAPTIDATTGKPVTASNVVVIHTDITATDIIEDSLGSHSLEIRSTGTGRAAIFQRGQRVDATWKRSGTDAFSFFALDGTSVALLPGGTTWVHIIPTDWTVTSAP